MNFIFYKILVIFKKIYFWFFSFSLLTWITSAQLLEIDYSLEKKEESSFRVHVIRYGIIGVSNLQHIDFSVEALKLRFDSKKGSHFSFSVYGTQTLWRGNKIDGLNTFDFVMNPMGGTINGNFFSSISIDRNDTNISKIALSLGKKWVEGQPLPNFENTRFFDNYGRLGIVHQRLLAEDPLQNTSLYFWGFPNLILHHSSNSSRQSFFDGELPSIAYGYGIEFGIDYNTQLKLIFLGQQIVNTSPDSIYGRVVARLTLAYKF